LGNSDFIFPKKIRFECINCGVCCGDTKEKNRRILMLSEETAEISVKNGIKISDFSNICSDKKPYHYEMNKKQNGKCFFLSSKNKCNIYLERPLICRFYPFELIDQSDGNHKFYYTDECPGINKGKTLDKKYFTGLFEQAKNRFQFYFMNINNRI